ncbi:hypothetical protein DMB95_02990 [Campylobacter sp. MIT 12-8780]|uniref:PepSY-like domain-containing protein n=1 Tax=unclassified Campylobacter TaxID=2593542 RepID=UPI0010F6E739|nr:MULTISPECIES: PepSY-like domain-containing protein [unclassified Campylobacter]NDJ26969.1 hypothetical protein [Campylobacter sp. MIT 19-121]TKX29077.1 hypothetical protein CQA38_05825 [Campylobacter sp. MIT 12-5580]TQR41890.1 hypothetical protein DMB95_02990 [Campylobacter sp. MIT 12-8780]
MKLKLILASLTCGASFLLADMVVAPNTLPANAQGFIKQNFPAAQIMLVKRDLDSFDVTLNDGTEIDFNINGQWTSVDGKYKAIPTGFLGQAIVSKVRAAQPNAVIIDVDRKIGGFKFKLNNMMEVYTDMNGNVLGQQFDD